MIISNISTFTLFMPLTPTPKNKRYNDMVNSTVLYNNILNTPASVDHSPPYTPIAKFLNKPHNDLPLHQQVTNGVLRAKIAENQTRNNLHKAYPSPIKLRMQHNNDAVRRRRNDETRDIAYRLESRVQNVKSAYAQRSPAMASRPSMPLSRPPTSIPRTGYDLLSNDYEAQAAALKEAARRRSLERQVVGKLCSEHAMTQKECQEFLRARGGVDSLVRRPSSRGQEVKIQVRNSREKSVQLDFSGMCLEKDAIDEISDICKIE